MASLTDYRAKIADHKIRDEATSVAALLDRSALDAAACTAIVEKAASIVECTRASRDKRSLLDAFLKEYGLSNQEGVALMCLAEALLRVPDEATRDDLIADKIAPGKWLAHVGKSESLFVNASTWGLLLTGSVVALDPEFREQPGNWLGRTVNRLGEPVIRTAMLHAMRILGAEFVLGETIDEAIKRGRKAFGTGQVYSFDMLGEGARTFDDARKHFAMYQNAIEVAGQLDAKKDITKRSGVSVKLSALHPRYEFSKRAEVLETLGASLMQLATRAAALDIHMSIDAEEADRLDLSLDLFERLARAPELKNWNGLGLVIQAYGKRALPVIEWLDALAKDSGRTFMVRLVKGAYWDSEIKHAQEQGLDDFPVFTRKSSTDLSYLVCAQELLKRRDRLICQFATHNAHSIAAIMHMARATMARVEFQRLHGMGELVYAQASQVYGKDFPQVRIYAPVGGHKDLLAYLVRRLLENGANSSFVNRFLDARLPARDVVRDPVQATRALPTIRHPKITLPRDLFGPSRRNAAGLDLSVAATITSIEAAIVTSRKTNYTATPLIPNVNVEGRGAHAVVSPADKNDIVGDVIDTTAADIDIAFDVALHAHRAWDRLGGAKRAKALHAAADAFESEMPEYLALLVREAGKTYADALAEVREAIDFCRYYAVQAEAEFDGPVTLPGPVGETNTLSLHGAGVFVCISPWNFPLAIFVGQLTAALAAGNSVIAKPAEQTSIIGHEAVKLLHRAGIPPEVLLLTPGDGRIGADLVKRANVAGVAFTGSNDTARAINTTLAGKDGPIASLIAETGGQNVMFVDSTALLEQVADDVVRSAFYSAGQRCSALRVLYVQSDIADKAIKIISGAMDALKVGDPAKYDTDIGPIIDADAAASLQAHIDALKQQGAVCHHVPLSAECANGIFIEPHLFEIENISDLKREHFGPILHVIRYKAADIDATLAQAFGTGYGLTLGVHTRIDRHWRAIFKRAPVGNTYINRNMVGAVVGSQPFGGQGLSGTGFKAGGPRYLYRFATEKTCSVNTMASGGNADLLTLEDD